MVKVILNNDLSEIEAAEVALLDVSATWCGPCKAIAPLIEELSEEFSGRVEFFNADAEENPEIAKKFRVMSIPNIMILKKGKVVSRQVGAQSRDAFKSWIEENIK